MDIQKFNTDLRILEKEFNLTDKSDKITTRNVFWKPAGDGSYFLYIKGVPLPANAKPSLTNVKIHAPVNLYDPAGGKRKYFYMNIWVDPNIQVKKLKKNGWGKLPRLHEKDSDGFSFLCIHPDTVEGSENILHFLATLKVFIKNADPDVW